MALCPGAGGIEECPGATCADSFSDTDPFSARPMSAIPTGARQRPIGARLRNTPVAIADVAEEEPQPGIVAELLGHLGLLDLVAAQYDQFFRVRIGENGLGKLLTERAGAARDHDGLDRRAEREWPAAVGDRRDREEQPLAPDPPARERAGLRGRLSA